MRNKSDYIIKKISSSQYDIAKYIDGRYSITYNILLGRASTNCNCISGHARGYCKHKDWVRDLIEGRTLPNNVEVAKVITQQDLEVFAEEMGI